MSWLIDKRDDRKCGGQISSPVPLHTVAPEGSDADDVTVLILHVPRLAENSDELARRNVRVFAQLDEANE